MTQTPVFGDEYFKRATTYANSPFWMYEVGVLADAARRRGLFGGPHIMDIGCNDGRLLRIMQMLLNASRAVGLDVNEAALQRGKTLGSGIEFIRIGQYDAVPMPDCSMDAAFCLNTLGHVHNPILTLCGILRALRPGGLLLLSGPNWSYYRIRDFMRSGAGDPTLKHEFTTRAWKNVALKTGFEVLNVTNYGNSLPILGIKARVLLELRKPQG